MVTFGSGAIFRLPIDPADGVIEDDIDDKIEFSPGAQTPDNNTKLLRMSHSINRHDTKQDIPFTETVASPDTGLSGRRYDLDLLFYEPQGPGIGINLLDDWVSNPNTVRGIYTNGRIGIRIDRRPELNVTPTRNEGYKIIETKISTDYKFVDFTRVRVVLQYSRERVAP